MNIIFNSIKFLFSAELFDGKNRSRAMAIAAAINWIANSIVAFSYPVLEHKIGGYTFFIFSALLLLFILYTIFCVPETKGKTVQEIQQFFISLREGERLQETADTVVRSG